MQEAAAILGPQNRIQGRCVEQVGVLGGRSCWRLCDLRSRGAEAGSRANITQPQAGITPLAPQVLGGCVFAHCEVRGIISSGKEIHSDF